MVVYRRIFKMRTVGSRATGNLRPEISDRTPTGIQYAVHEYNEEQGWCVVECWCSDHPVLPTEHQKGQVDLEALDTDSSVLQVLKSHSLSPLVLGGFSTTTHDSVDEAKKEIVVRGRKGKFIRKEEVTDTGGKKQAQYVLDEG